MENTKYSERFRPDTIDGIVLLDRFKKIYYDGLNCNYIFHGNSGCGKTTFARILTQKHKENGSLLVLNSKLGVEELRTTAYKFCTTMIPMEDPNILRVIYFEEFDRATSSLQEELKTFIEEHPNVIFLATCNHINNLKTAVRSRFKEIDFTVSQQESIILKKETLKHITTVLNENKINFNIDFIKKTILKRFPDIRKMWNDIQYETSTIDIDKYEVDDNELYKILLFSDTETTWDFVEKYFIDRIDSCFELLGKPLFVYIRENQKDKIHLLKDIFPIISEYSDNRMPKSFNPFITLMALIYDIQKILK